MTQIHTSRTSDHPYIDTVWRTECETDGIYNATPDGAWDLILSIEPNGHRFLFFSGQQTESMQVPYKKGERSIVISFAASTKLRHKSAPMQPLEIDGNFFLYEGVRLPMPTYTNAEELTDLMIQHNLIENDEVVAGILSDKPRAASARSIQMHFRDTTGITRKTFDQIRRAQKAVRLLQEGKKASEVAAEVGYTDQAHMARSLKKIMGRLPSNVDDVHKL